MFTSSAGLIFYFLIPPNPRLSLARLQLFGTGVNTSPPSNSVLRSSDPWSISLQFAAFNLVFTSFVTWTSTYLNQVREISIVNADFLISMTSMLAIGFGPLGRLVVG